MNWRRNSSKVGREYELLPFLLVVMAVVSIVAGRAAILLIVGFVITFMVLIHFYNERIGQKLILENNRRSIRMFEGEEIELEIVIKNKSILPVINGHVSFTTNEKVGSERFVRFSKKQKNHYHVPLLLMGKSEARIPIELVAKQRGVVRLKDIEYSFPHIMNFEQIILSYHSFYQTEILVYPTLSPVAGIEELSYNNFGNQVTRFSPFEDLLSPVGTRDYVASDPFHRIHWKASAKNQTLQTKIYERNRNISWTIVVNIAKASPLGNVYASPNMEKYISQAAYICHAITKLGYPMELFINAAKVGSIPFHLESDSGHDQLKTAFEMLTRTEKDSTVLPLTNILHRINNQTSSASIVVIIGDIDHSSHHYVNNLRRQGNGVFHVTDFADGARLTEVKSERVAVYDAQ